MILKIAFNCISFINVEFLSLMILLMTFTAPLQDKIICILAFPFA